MVTKDRRTHVRRGNEDGHDDSGSSCAERRSVRFLFYLPPTLHIWSHQAVASPTGGVAPGGFWSYALAGASDHQEEARLTHALALTEPTKQATDPTG